jgi:phage-related protein
MSASAWSVLLTDEAAVELDGQPEDIRAQFEWIKDLIVAHGLIRLRKPYVEHLEGKLWEIRLKGRDGIARALYVTTSGRRVVVVRVFTKKTTRTPRKEIELALRRAEEIT